MCKTLQEFCTAMHLVVLKRNQVELPTTLPPSLMPYVPASSEPFAADLDDERQRSPSPAEISPVQHQNSWPGTTETNVVTNNCNWKEQQGTAGEQWANSDQVFGSLLILHPITCQLNIFTPYIQMTFLNCHHWCFVR